MKKDNFKKGRIGENIAKSFLADKGFGFIEANYKDKIGEIDLVMKDRDFLVFIEVKYKKDNSLGRPEEMIDKRKLAQIKRSALSYCVEKNIDINKTRIRIDAVCISLDTINYYENIY